MAALSTAQLRSSCRPCSAARPVTPRLVKVDLPPTFKAFAFLNLLTPSARRVSIGAALDGHRDGRAMGRRNVTLLAGGLLALVLVGVEPVDAGTPEYAAAAYGKGDYVTALRLLGPLAAQGNAYAETYLGLMDANGQGGPRAIGWYRKAADQGYAPAQFNLGVVFEAGRGVPQSSIEAVTWYRKAANQGHIDAQRRVGLLCH
jgi:TPR repeat protein